MTFARSTVSDEENPSSLDQTDPIPAIPDIGDALSEEEIFAEATDYQSWHGENCCIKNLPAFDNSCNFGITIEDENLHLREEIRKLVRAVNRQEEASLFNSHGAFRDTDLSGFGDLIAVVDQIYSAFQVIQHDNAALFISRYVSQSCFDVIKRSRANLRAHYVRAPSGAEDFGPLLLDGENRNLQAYHTVLDFVLHTMAWWITRVTERKRFRKTYLAVLARWSVKLKLIALDPARWAKDSMSRAEDILRRVSQDQANEEAIKIQFPEEAMVSDSNQRQGEMFPQDKDKDYPYYTTKFQFRQHLWEIFSDVIRGLQARYPQPQHATLEVRSVMYRDGLDDSLRHLTVRSNGTIQTTSDPTDMIRSYIALRLLLTKAEALADKKRDLRTRSDEMAEVKWSLKPIKARALPQGSFTTTRIDDVVSVLVPLALAEGSGTIRELDRQLKRLANPNIMEVEPISAAFDLVPEKFPELGVTLITKRIQSGFIPKTKTSLGLLSPSKAPLIDFTEEHEEDGNQGGPAADPTEHVPGEKMLKLQAKEIRKDYNDYRTEIDSWTVTQDNVLVRTRVYSFGALAIAFGVIAGCIPLPFIIGNNLPGVDPFQIVTFGWLVAGAFLVGAKSRYVESWPWHDFLRGQVVCRSVSELAVASRVPEQAVLLYLLHNEFRHALLLAGPYNGVFKRTTLGGEGFSVDRPTWHATIQAAGFIVMEILAVEAGSWERYTILQDTRGGQANEILTFRPDEKTKADARKDQVQFVRKKDDEDKGEASVDADSEVVGLSTKDCSFT